jgi:hypothetical protein
MISYQQLLSPNLHRIFRRYLSSVKDFYPSHWCTNCLDLSERCSLLVTYNDLLLVRSYPLPILLLCDLTSCAQVQFHWLHPESVNDAQSLQSFEHYCITGKHPVWLCDFQIFHQVFVVISPSLGAVGQ